MAAMWSGAEVHSFAQAVTELRRGVETLPLEADELHRVGIDLSTLETLATGVPDPIRAGIALRQLAATLEEAGIAVRDVLTLVAPIRRMSALLGVSVPDL